MKPTVGRIVLVRWPESETAGELLDAEYPAIIQRVYHDDHVRLWVFGAQYTFTHDTRQGTERGEWRWPERV